MKILAVSNFFPPFHAGGYGVLCYRLCECMRQAGHQIVVLTTIMPSGAEHDPGGYKIEMDVRRELLFIKGGNAFVLLRNTIRNKNSVSRCIDEVKPDLIYCFGIDGVGFQVYHTAVESGLPSITVAGDTWLGQAWRDLPKFDPWIALATGRASSGLMRILKRSIGIFGRCVGLYTGRAPRSARPVHAISSFLATDLVSSGMPWTTSCRLIRYPLAPPFVVGDGVPVGSDGSASNCLRVLFVSRMEPLKGPDIAIKGVVLARRLGVDVCLTMTGIGQSRMQASLRRLADGEGFGSYVRWVDAPDPESLVALYRAHDVFVFPSLITEGLGIVCLEAMACGLPVVATEMGGQLDVVKHGQTGFLFAPGDWESLAKHLVVLARDADLRNRLSRGAVDMARKHNVSDFMVNIPTPADLRAMHRCLAG